jgi:hypothetical protein
MKSDLLQRPAKLTQGQLVRYRVAVRQQLILWLSGRSVHNAVTGECCPDFSCCYPDLLSPQDERNRFCLEHLEGHDA